MPLYPKRGIGRLRPVAHGGIDPTALKDLGVDPEKVLDFSVCTNPYMPPSGIQEVLAAAPIERYPDSASSALREKLSRKLRVPAESILAGGGTTELIRLVALAYLRRGDVVLTIEPTYGEYESAAPIAGARVVKHRAAEEDDFVSRTGEVVEVVRRLKPRAVFLCNPNNPTGRYLGKKDVEAVLEASGDGLLVLDEAYVAFVENAWSPFDLVDKANLVILRSMTKDYGLPGLRLGYAVARAGIIDVLRRVAPPWNVNAVAQQAGLYVLDRDAYLRQSLRRVRQSRDYLVGELSRLGFTVLPTDANYFLVRVGDGAACRRSLLKKGILVRDCASFGLPQYVRIAPRTLPDCRRLVRAMEAVLDSGEVEMI